MTELSRAALNAGDQQRSRGRRIGLAVITAGGVLVLAAVWLGITSLMARGQLNEVRTDAHALSAQISAGSWPAARANAADLAVHAHRANQLTSGPVWAVAASLPWGGEPLRTIRGLTAGADSLSREALPPLVSAAERLNPRTLRHADGSIDLARISAVTPAVTAAAASVAQTTTMIGALPEHTWASPVDAAYADALSEVTTLNNTLRSADLTARILPTMLGADSPKEYLLAFQNEAEARGTGGLPGALAIVVAKNGKLTFSRMESDDKLADIAATVDFGPDYHHLYEGSDTTTQYVDGNVSPHFPYAAQIWASMWNRYSGQKVDGVIAVDPTALGYLLAVTGPATLPDKSQVNGANAVALTQSTSYARFAGTGPTGNTARKAYLLEVASAASKKVLSARGDPTALLRAISQAAGERRILLWSADPAVQKDIAQTSVAGVIPTTTAPYVGLSIVNTGGNKLDYYLDRSLTWQRTGCGSTRRTTVTITLRNNAPASGLTPYVTGRLDTHSYRVRPGDNRLGVSYLATQGALMNSVTVAGRPGTASIGAENGHPVYSVDLELPRGTSRTIVLRLTEPAGTGAPVVLRQPLVRPLYVSLKDSICG
jgi:hypothetical protein